MTEVEPNPWLLYRKHPHKFAGDYCIKCGVSRAMYFEAYLIVNGSPNGGDDE